ncbi:MAG: UDP-3-O-(3-hydroxymyristoyl)glucosamine N-acyltransferase [Gammaproteobacteria bacterium]|jgi:UDP-3-O-[3-hydroxymyristoyl] glucosamine N-acyltransferase|nr:UDP-3-O-(3-hydroxymyristoyl)glucosamine N-acyltransferase [Gammaproteobacteria bacterium]
MSRAYTAAELAESEGLELRGDGDTPIRRVAPLDRAEADAIAFLALASHRHHLATTRAGAVILTAEMAEACPTTALVSPNPHATYARIAQLLHPRAHPPAGIHPSAVVGEGCRLGAGVSIGANAVLGDDCVLGADVVIGAGSVLGNRVTVGDDSRLVASVTLCDDTVVGRRALLQPGAVIGGDGFGFASDDGHWLRIPQIGRVVLGDDVEVGANTTIDRGAIDDTVIGNGVKLDNLIMIGHNVCIGENTAMAACVGIAGSVTIGARCTFGGGAIINGHIEIVDDVHVTGNSMIVAGIDKPGLYSSGMPLMGNREWRKNMARLKKLDELARRVTELERDAEK